MPLFSSISIISSVLAPTIESFVTSLSHLLSLVIIIARKFAMYAKMAKSRLTKVRLPAMRMRRVALVNNSCLLRLCRRLVERSSRLVDRSGRHHGLIDKSRMRRRLVEMSSRRRRLLDRSIIHLLSLTFPSLGDQFY